MKPNLTRPFLAPIAFVLVIIFVELLDVKFQIKAAQFGVFPRSFSGLKGIVFSPFIHGDWKHVFNNSIPLIVLGSSLKYFYKDISKEVFLWSWLMSGLWLWVIGRENYHIGASGIVYALASFLFFSGLIRKHTKLMAISFFVVFMYGGLVWGLLPIRQHISWEGHLSGAAAGLILAWWFRNEGPKKQIYQYELEEENQEIDVTYHYKKD